MKILIDFHGVLTDGKLNITHDGQTMFESVNVRDIRAIRELIAYGNEVYIITASSSPIIDAYCRKVGCEKMVLRDKSQVPFDEPFVAIGDDAWDIPMLRKTETAFCPSDAIRDIGCHVTRLRSKGGEGVIDEFLNTVFKAKGGVLHEIRNGYKIYK